MATTLQEIVDEVTAQKTAVDSLQAFVDGLRAQIGAISSITPSDQAMIDNIFAAVDANTQVVAKAMAANVPPAPVSPAPVPPVV